MAMRLYKNQTMKLEWKKSEKAIYLPGTQPEIITLPAFKFFVIAGEGNPNDDFFGNYIEALYALSYAVKMSPRSGLAPEGYHDYAVYPLEGVWDLTEDAKKIYSGTLNKNDLVFNLMIRQPDFVSEGYALTTIEKTMKKKPNRMLEKVKFVVIEEGECIQMMHLGSYDAEPESFAKMEEFCRDRNLLRISRQHREIYLSDARKVSPDKLRTVLRFGVKG
jgi:hypothetical protein